MARRRRRGGHAAPPHVPGQGPHRPAERFGGPSHARTLRAAGRRRGPSRRGPAVRCRDAPQRGSAQRMGAEAPPGGADGHRAPQPQGGAVATVGRGAQVVGPRRRRGVERPDHGRSDGDRLREGPAVRRGAHGRRLGIAARQPDPLAAAPSCRAGPVRRARAVRAGGAGGVRSRGEPVRVGAAGHGARRAGTGPAAAGGHRRGRLDRSAGPRRRRAADRGRGRLVRVPQQTQRPATGLRALHGAGPARLAGPAVQLGAGDVRTGLRAGLLRAGASGATAATCELPRSRRKSA